MESGKVLRINVFQDLLNSFQDTISRDGHLQEINVDLNVLLHPNQNAVPNVESIYKQIMLIGKLYKNIVYLLDQHNKSMVTEGLIKSVKKYLQMFSTEAAEICTQENCVTLRWALVWSRRLATPLQYMTTILQATHQLKGSSVLEVLSGYLHHGNMSLYKLSNDMFEGASESFCRMMWLWLIVGALKDPYNEFFITKNALYTKADCWDMKYVLRVESIPNILSLDTAKLIFDGGRMINFILLHFEDMEPRSQTRMQLLELQNEPHCGLFELLIERNVDFCSKIENLHWDYSQHILVVLKEGFDLSRHFKGVHWYIFLTLGNFGRHFLELIYPLYYSNADCIEIQLIKQLLKNAVISTSPFLRNKDKIKEAEYVSGNWKNLVKYDRLCDVLQIKYDRGPPISKILPSFEVQHVKINSIIWKMQHIQYSLSHQRKLLLHLANMVCFKKNMEENWEAMYYHNAALNQFFSQVNFYIVNDVIEEEWKEFWEQYTKAHTIDEVINIYGRLLNRVLYKLVDNKNKEVNISLNVFHGIITDGESLTDDMEQTLINRNGSLDAEELHAKISILKTNFQNSVKDLLKRISADNRHERLMHLCERINFNNYYDLK